MIRLSFWGDCKINDPRMLQIDDQVKKVLMSCDYNAINFEAPIHGVGFQQQKSGPTISQSPDTPKWLREIQFNIFAFANNHIMDYGVDGLKHTLTFFKNDLTLGAGSWDDAYRLTVVQKNQMKVGFLNLTHCEFGTLTDRFDYQNNIGTAWISHPSVPKIITNSKKIVDFLIIMAHAGVENIEIPLPEWREMYRSFIELGADVIIGTHPHIPQGWEKHKEGLIFYSLGNFCFQKSSKHLSKYWDDSLCVIININDNQTFEYEVKNIKKVGNLIYENNDPGIKAYTQKINEYLINEKYYQSVLDANISSLYQQYINLFERSGFYMVKYDGFFLIKLIKAFLKKKRFPTSHLLNNLRCESHRWAISRAIMTNISKTK